MDRLIIGQLNLHNDRIATSELDRLITEYKLDLVLVQEQYQRAGLLYKFIQLNNSSRAGIYVPRSSFTFTSITNLSSTHCAVAEVSTLSFKIFVVSCYFQFSDSINPHLHHLRHVLHSLSGEKVIIGADVNASSPLWFGKLRYTDADRRSAVEDFIAEMNLIVHNTPDAPPTFSSPVGESSIDVTLSSADVLLNNWRVLPDASCSDHRLIVCDFASRSRPDPVTIANDFRYRCNNVNWNFFGGLFALHAKDFTRSDLSTSECAEIMTNTFTYCADIAVGRKPLTNRRRCDWWNAKLVNLRRDFRRTRRTYNKIRKAGIKNGPIFENATIALRLARSHYRAAVVKSKGMLIQRVVEKLEKEGPWSPLYHEFKANKSINCAYITNIKFNNEHTMGVAETTNALLDALIPDDSVDCDNDYHREIRFWASQPPSSPASDLPSTDEFLTIVQSLSVNKAAGEDKISNKMIKEACKTAGDSILTVYNRCISEGIFPEIWRRGTIKIIPKRGDKAPDDPKSYRPITLLPSLGKVLERLVVPRLLPGGPNFRVNQFGFTVGKSAMDALISVRESVEGSRFRYVLGVFLDISGAFDNAWWPMLLLKLKSRGCFNNIYSLLYSYFVNGKAKLKLGHHAASKRLTKGCPQGSVLGPYLWNLGFDDFLSIPLPPECSLTGYADDGLLLIHSNTRAGIQRLANDCLSLIYDWGIRNRLQFAPQKTYQLLLKGNLKNPPCVKFNGVSISHKSSVCYLGLVLERNFSFLEHVKQVGEKAKRNFYALTRISKSTWGLKFKTMKVIYGATYLGCITYGSPVFADRSTIGAVRRKLLQSQRLALIFLCKAYRTVSTEALPVLAGVVPVDLEIQRRAADYYLSKQLSSSFLHLRNQVRIERLFTDIEEVKDDLMSEWQNRWDASIKGRHLHKFFPLVRERMLKPWIEVDHCVAQFLTGHGNFKSKLHSFKLVPSPFCECSSSADEYEQTAHHILWECCIWQHDRDLMLDSIQATSGVVYYEDLVATRDNYRAFWRFCHAYYWNNYNK